MAKRGKGDQDQARGVGRRGGRNTTYSTPAYDDAEGGGDRKRESGPSPGGGLAPGGGGTQEEVQGFHQATAMFDRGELLGELAELELGSEPSVSAEAEAVLGCRLICVAGPEIGRVWRSTEREVVIGRDDDCGVVLEGEAVSRRHARLTKEGASYRLSDLGSGNGTYLNGDRTEDALLSAGDEVAIGGWTVRFVQLSESEVPKTGEARAEDSDSKPDEEDEGDDASQEDDEVPDSEAADSRASSLDKEAGFRTVGPKGTPESSKPMPPVSSAASSKFLPSEGSAPPSKRVLWTIVAFIVAGAAGGVYVLFRAGYFYDGWSMFRSDQTMDARRRFLQGIELVKAKRCGDAIELFDRVLALQPENLRAVDYRTHCEQEVGFWKLMESSKKLAKAFRFEAAIAKLSSISSESVYASQAERLADHYLSLMEARVLKRIQARLDANSDGGALDLIARTLDRYPGFAKVRAMRTEIEARRQARLKAQRNRRRTPSRSMKRAIALYRSGGLDEALNAARNAKGSGAADLTRDMLRVRTILKETAAAHKGKDVSKILSLAPQGLAVDLRIAGGQGRLRSRLKTYYADGLYLRGIDAYQRDDPVLAFRLFSQALRVRPGHVLSKARVSELAGLAHKLFDRAQTMGTSDAAEAKRLLRTVMKLTRPEDDLHRRAKQWLRQRGP